jgi:hypothetical protein
VKRLLIIAAIVLAACNASVPAANVPPAGSIWFGSAFDVKTFALTGQASSFTAGQPVAMVAHLSRKSTGESMTIQISGSGYNGPMGGGSLGSGNDVMGQVLPGLAFPVAATSTVTVVDAGGNILASGTLTSH